MTNPQFQSNNQPQPFNPRDQFYYDQQRNPQNIPYANEEMNHNSNNYAPQQQVYGSLPVQGQQVEYRDPEYIDIQGLGNYPNSWMNEMPDNVYVNPQMVYASSNLYQNQNPNFGSNPNENPHSQMNQGSPHAEFPHQNNLNDMGNPEMNQYPGGIPSNGRYQEMPTLMEETYENEYLPEPSNQLFYPNPNMGQNYMHENLAPVRVSSNGNYGPMTDELHMNSPQEMVRASPPMPNGAPQMRPNYSKNSLHVNLARNDVNMEGQSVISGTPKVFVNEYEDDCLYMNLEEEYLHKVSMQLKYQEYVGEKLT